MALFDGNPVARGKFHHQMTLPSTKPFPRRVKCKKMVTTSITKLEIERYWKNKHMEEEDHLFAAVKAAARIRARNLTEEVYNRFEESLKETLQDDDDRDEYSEESGVGIKDWWTRSKYAYLNQPAVGNTDKKNKTHSYVPNCCFYKTPDSAPGHTASPYLGVLSVRHDKPPTIAMYISFMRKNDELIRSYQNSKFALFVPPMIRG